MGYNIGFFKATDTGYTGTIETLALKIQADFHRVLDRKHENAPAYEILCGKLRIGAAWDRQGKSGRYLSVSLEDPSFSSGYYNLYRNSGVEDGYALSARRRRRRTSPAQNWRHRPRQGRQQCRPFPFIPHL
jgi:uncharacterized protein (DUF736 family)